MNDLELVKLLEQKQRYQQPVQTPQGRMVGRHFVNPNPLEYMAAALKNYGNIKGVEQTDTAIQNLQNQRQQATIDALKRFGKQMSGTPAQSMDMGQIDPSMAQFGSMETAPAVAPDPRGAYAGLLESRMPDLQKLGTQGMLQIAESEGKAAQEAEKLKRIQTALSSAKTPQDALRDGVPVEMVKVYFDKALGQTKGVVADGQLIDPFTGATIGQPIQRRPNLATDLLIPGPNGTMVPNQPLIEAKKGIAKSGASNVNMGVTIPGKKFYENVGTGVGEAVQTAYQQAQSGVQSLENANQMAKAIDKAFVGPLANQRMTLARLGEVLGVAGKDTNERLENTRNLMQGLARQELAAASQMKGQGQITESERAILRKAEAGEIQDMSKAELQVMVGAIRKTARSRIAIHDRNMQKLGIDPQAKELVDFMRLPQVQDYTGGPSEAPTGLPEGWKVRLR